MFLTAIGINPKFLLPAFKIFHDLVPAHLASLTLNCFLLLKPVSSFLPQGLCTCHSLCPEHSCPRALWGWLFPGLSSDVCSSEKPPQTTQAGDPAPLAFSTLANHSRHAAFTPPPCLAPSTAATLASKNISVCFTTGFSILTTVPGI